MLNELFELNSTMVAAGIVRPSWHKHYKTCPKTASFFVMIDVEGSVSGLERINDAERVVSIRKYEVANGFSFPALNALPLLHAKSDEAKEKVLRFKEMIARVEHRGNEAPIAHHVEGLWKTCEHLWSPNEKERIKKCLATAGLKDKLGNSIDNIPEDCRAIKELMSRSARLSLDDLLLGLKSRILEQLSRSPDADQWMDILLVSTAKTPKRASLVLEVADRSTFDYPSSHERIYRWINSRLMERQAGAGDKPATTDIDAFGRSILEEEKRETFPAMNLPVVGKVILRAMSSESPCQKRYGQIDAYSFPVSDGVRQSAKDSLEWMCGTNRKGKTWTDASGACGFAKRDGKRLPIPGLFLAYPSSLGEDPPELAAAFSRNDETLDPDGAKFESVAARVISVLRVMLKAEPDVEVRVLVLAKADKARTKVLASQKHNANALISGAAEWRQGCQNIPSIRLNIGTNDKAQWVQPVIPFPLEVVKCLNVAWLEGGRRTDEVHGLGIGEGIELFLETGVSLTRIAGRALSLVVTNAKPLFLALGHADHRRDGSIKLDSKQACLMLSILGLLLYKQNVAKGAYMHTAPFLVGRLLALADLLHKEYCVHVRNNDIPPQLIGNALMSSAVENPEKGLARLRERLMIYQAWANKVHGEDFRLARWSLKAMATVSNELADLDLPDRTNDADKAQMLLGYLARSEDKTSGNDDSSTLNSEREVSNVRP